MRQDKAIDKLIGYVQRAPSQEQIVKYLRTIKFCFYSSLAMWMCNSIKVPEKYYNYAWYIRQTGKKEGETDRRIIFGIKLNGRKTSYLIILKNGKFFMKLKIPWKIIKRTNFKKIEMKMKFTSMTYKERREWRNEHERLKKNPELKASKFYHQNKKYVQFL